MVVRASNQVNDPCGRYGSARNEEDRFDVFVRAHTPRTDRARVRPSIRYPRVEIDHDRSPQPGARAGRTALAAAGRCSSSHPPSPR